MRRVHLKQDTLACSFRYVLRSAPCLTLPQLPTATLQPRRMRDLLILWLGLVPGEKLQEHAVECTSLSMKYWSCFNACYLAGTEFKDLASAPDWSIIRRLGDRAAVIICPSVL